LTTSEEQEVSALKRRLVSDVNSAAAQIEKFTQHHSETLHQNRQALRSELLRAGSVEEMQRRFSQWTNGESARQQPSEEKDGEVVLAPTPAVQAASYKRGNSEQKRHGGVRQAQVDTKHLL
jgi:hypothetical protein